MRALRAVGLCRGPDYWRARLDAARTVLGRIPTAKMRPGGVAFVTFQHRYAADAAVRRYATLSATDIAFGWDEGKELPPRLDGAEIIVERADGLCCAVLCYAVMRFDALACES